MTASELSRLLLFSGYSEVADFINDSPLNRYLYKKLLVLMPKHDIDVPIVSLFNEVYYQCVRARFDSNPGVDVGKRYFPEVEVRFHDNLPAAQLVFCLVWVLFQLKRELTFNEECFIEQLEPFIHNIPSSIFREEADRLVEELKAIGAEAPDVFPTMTCPIDCLPTVVNRGERDRDVPNLVKIFLNSDNHETNLREWKDYSEAWKTVTEGFSHTTIERLVRLYNNPQDQCRLVKMIQDACTREDLLNHTRYFAELTARIRTGRFAAEREEQVVKQQQKETVKKLSATRDINIETRGTININIPTAHQVNINPQNVINNVVEGKVGSATNKE